MTHHHDLRSQAQTESQYANLPGTSRSGFVAHHMTALKSSLSSGREISGCNPSRWIYELLNNDFTVCDLFQRARKAKFDSTYTWDHPHKLGMNGNQSFSTPSSRVLSSICLDCHFHFVFKMTWELSHSDHLCHHEQSSWPLGEDQFPWHHLVWAGSGVDKELAREHCKFYPILARENFVCSAPPCTFQITLEVSEPRMPQTWIKLLLDREAICEQLRLAKEQEPSRYEGATDDWAYQATLNLNTYLKNLLESSDEEARSISKRNKRFAVLFGPRCFPMFRELDFIETVEMKDGVDEGSFSPSTPPPAGGPSGATEIGTYRSYLEDVRAEVQCLIHKAGQAAERPTIITPVLHADLGSQELPSTTSRLLIKTERYKLIGVLPNQSREAVVNAYHRQWDLLPSRRRNLVDSMRAIANDMGDAQFSEYAMIQSSLFESSVESSSSPSRRNDDGGAVPEALVFLGLQPSKKYDADSLIGAFRVKLALDPANAATARSMLLVIAQHSDDDVLQTRLLMEADAKMSLETSRAVLGLDGTEVPWQTVSEAAKTRVGESSSKIVAQLCIDALEAIADHTFSPALKQAAVELRQDSGVFQAMGTSDGDSGPINLSLPVGLHNIGNTCYLNSLLQYLFTVKPIRDIVFNYEDVKLALTDESIRSRLLGGNKMQMDRGEAVVAQAFAKELAELFNQLMTSRTAAARPSQRLANAVLLSTHTLLRDAHSTPAEPPRPPPLPARPPPATPKANEDVKMTESPVPRAVDYYDMETASHSSSRTLVDIDLDDAQSDRSYEKIDKMHASQGADDFHEAPSIDDGATISETSTSSPLANEPARTSIMGATALLSLSRDSSKDGELIEAGAADTVDQKVLNALEHQKRSSGTDQQDVEEVMGSIINRLQAAIKPTHVDHKTGVQLERIMETFFVTTINYTKKFDETHHQSEISFDRAITAFPAPNGPCSLYDALGRNFDQQILEDSKLARYTAIKTLPPVLHILIQRSQSTGSKNGNAVVIPETLFLDRYMDAPHDSPLFRRRVEDWALSDRISDLKALIAQVDPNPDYISHLEAYSRGTAATKNPSNVGVDAASSPDLENWDFDGAITDEDSLSVETSIPSGLATAPLPELKPLDIRQTDALLRQMMWSELEERENRLRSHREDFEKTPYRLHAVICHRGHLTSGHYWVWIHDFKDNVWRWYNDSDVKESKDTAEVLQTLSTSGEPYFLCYVRDQDKDDFVDIPKRQEPIPAPERHHETPSTAATGKEPVADPALHTSGVTFKEQTFADQTDMDLDENRFLH